MDTIEYKGYEIEIKQDEDAESPRNWDNVGKMICFHGRYELGDKHDLKSDDFNGWEELEKYLIKEEKAFIILPLYLYDHGGITISTGAFSCRWDSGQVGFIYCTKEQVLKEWGGKSKRVTKKIRDRAISYLEGEVKTYDQYLSGDVYGYIVSKDGEHIHSCWGYYGSDECEKEAKRIVDYEVQKSQKENEKKLKAYIKNHVPLEKRTFVNI